MSPNKRRIIKYSVVLFVFIDVCYSISCAWVTCLLKIWFCNLGCGDIFLLVLKVVVNGVPLSSVCCNSRTALDCICELLGYLRSQFFYMCRLCSMTASSVSLFSLHSLCYFDVATGVDTTVTERRRPNQCLPFFITESYWIYGGCANTSKKDFLYRYAYKYCN